MTGMIPLGFTNVLMSSPVIDLAFEPSIGITAKRLMKLEHNLKSFREPLELAVREVMRPSIKQNFQVGGRPTWVPLAESTIKRKQKKGNTTKILIETKKLSRVAAQRNIWTIGRTSAIIDGHMLPSYAGIHQGGAAGEKVTIKNALSGKTTTNLRSGYGSIPARPFLLIQESDKEKIRTIFLTWLEKRIVVDWGAGV